ncbi:4-coumarate-ligase [Lasallia pustulata]|uniref:4-coumarate-ligase n=1 Tax=Lasallia pustulata TaxID=136370 RepID=A0A1W5D982_9LECA|nr:4-coumarate-ligase [Lasallia pustulata]
MGFKAPRTTKIPSKDLLSWTFDELPYDQDQPIYIDAANPSRSLSARQAKPLIRKLVAGFRNAGLKEGEVVCIYYSLLFLAIVAAGGIFAGTNPGYTTSELVHHIRTSHTKFLIVEPELLDPILHAAKECKILERNIFMFDIHQPPRYGFESWTALLKHGEQDWVRFDDEETSKKTTAARLYSSGTTGLPKAAICSHYNLVAQHQGVFEDLPRPWDVRRLVCLPMFHAACVPVGHTTPLRSGHVAYVMRRFELEPFLRNIEQYQITDIGLVPPLALAVIMSPLRSKYSMKSVRNAVCGAAPLKKGPQSRFQALLAPNAAFTQVWGMTETTCIATLFFPGERDDEGSVGRPIANLEIKLIDDDGKDITGYGVRGELCVRGPTIFSGYLNPEANKAAFDGHGWFKTGDIGYCDGKTKKWFIIDRKKELIKVRGFQVAPPELEAVLLMHPEIVDAAVIGVVMDDAELPRAYVVRRPESAAANDLTEEMVKDYSAGRLAKYKRLEGGVSFVDAIPRNASGKILKTLLREQAKKELGGGRARL